MDLKGYESYAATGQPVVGATVEVREASDDHPNAGSVIDSTTTDSNGMWEFTGLSDTPKDVKISYSGQVWWYKGNTRHSVSSLYTDGAAAEAAPYPLLRNGGLEYWGTGNGPVTITTATRFADVWKGTVSGGSTGTATKETTVVAAGSNASAKLVFSRVSGSFLAELELPAATVAALRGKEIYVSAQVRQGVASNTRMYITDSAGTSSGSTEATINAFNTLTATRTINSAATSVKVGLEILASDTVYLDNAALLIGNVAPVFGPSSVDTLLDDEYVTTDQSATPAQAGTLRSILNFLAAKIKAIQGTTNWWDAPAATLASLNTAVSTAQSTANSAASAASTAQSTANTAVSNAATAQSTANTAVSNAATAQSTADSAAAVANGKIDQGTADARYFRIDVTYPSSSFGVGTLTVGGVSVTPSSYSTTSHNHSGVYSAAGHDHSGTYAAASHASGSNADHDSRYAKLSGATFTGGVTLSSGVAMLGPSWSVSSGGAAQFAALNVTGSKSAAIPGPDGVVRLFHATEAPEPWFEDFGRVKLRGGQAWVWFPEDFGYFVSRDDYHIQITPEGAASLYVAQRTRDGFLVRALQGDQYAPFSWRIVARRKDISSERLATEPSLSTAV